MNKKIGFIGCGNMAEAIIKGLLSRKAFRRGNILASEPRASRRRYIKAKYRINILSSNQAVVPKSDILVIAVKPQNIDSVLSDIKRLAYNKLIISVTAGIKAKRIQDNIPGARVIRVMPNTPALVGSGITAIAKSRTARASDYYITKGIFSCVGEVVETEERYMDIITATSGSGPAYFFLFMQALIDAAASCGLKKAQAEKLVMDTAMGSIKLALQSRDPLETLRKKVTSKGGTTEAALKVFEKYNFGNIVKKAVKAAAKRSKELSK